MATATGIGGGSSVVEFRTAKCQCGVATIATQLGLKVISWHHHTALCDGASARMTAAAFLGRSLENATEVAGLAPRIGMYATERKSCLRMIESVCSTLRNAAMSSQYHQRRKQCFAGKVPKTQRASRHSHGFPWVREEMELSLDLNCFQLSTEWHCSQRVPNCPSCTSSRRWHAMQVPFKGAASRPAGAGRT